MNIQPMCENCGKVAFEVTELRVEELIPGVAREAFVLRCPECDYDRPEEAYESNTAEERFRAVEKAIHFFGSVEAALPWLDSPSMALGGATPRSHLDTSEGASRVRALVEDLWGAERAEWDRRSAVAKARFQEWVVKWSIGPGMDDHAPALAEDRPLARPLRSADGAPLYSGNSGYVGPGWLPLLDRLAADLVALGWDHDLHQVKEKFGGLCFYIGKGSPEILERIQLAERESLEICEDCGGPGKPRRGRRGWVRTVCSNCADEMRSFA